jgi:hypothetical protein
MNELKAIRGGDIHDDVIFFSYNSDGKDRAEVLYYLKSEADKVIAELEMKLAAAKLVLRLNEPKALYSNLDTMSRLNHKIDVVERRELHQKYKRCLAMYRYCSIKALYELDFKGNDAEWKWYSKWMHTWFKLAMKFKEAK